MVHTQAASTTVGHKEGSALHHNSGFFCCKCQVLFRNGPKKKKSNAKHFAPLNSRLI